MSKCDFNKVTKHLPHIFRAPFLKITSGRLLLVRVSSGAVTYNLFPGNNPLIKQSQKSL